MAHMHFDASKPITTAMVSKDGLVGIQFVQLNDKGKPDTVTIWQKDDLRTKSVAKVLNTGVSTMERHQERKAGEKVKAAAKPARRTKKATAEAA